MSDAIKILLVDDEPRNLDALEAILDDATYRLLRATNADAALKLLLENDVAAIVLDIKMPGISGFELANMIKGTKRFRQIPIVFLTAYLVDDKDVITGYGAGAVDYLTKPFNPLVLRHKVAVFAELFRKTRALAELNAHLEARVQERTAELEQSSRLKDEFLAMMSHELRTPLNAMLGWATILKEDSSNPEKRRRGLEAIERNARAQARIVSDLLDVSGIVTGKLRLVLREVEFSAVIRGAVEVVRPAAEGKGVRLLVDLDSDLGATMGDADRLQQVIWNVLTNAIRFTPANGSVRVTARREAGTVELRVEDDGAGIPVEHLPHIFERFRQVDSSTTRAHGGLGLGLAIVRHLVEAHGGSVEASSEGLGRGAAFILSFPVRPSEARESEPYVADNDAADLALTVLDAGLADARLLVIDDDPDSLDLTRTMLEAGGAKVVCARGAREAIEARGHFDAIVSDIGMPHTDGYALLRRLRSSGVDAPAVALTAYARASDASQAMQAGFDEHLVKPIDARKLVDTVKRLIGGSAPTSADVLHSAGESRDDVGDLAEPLSSKKESA